jgi:protein-S-isoprenylcysteine O-methyltransferase Ste14
MKIPDAAPHPEEPTGPDRPDVITLPPLIYLLGLAFGLYLHALFPASFSRGTAARGVRALGIGVVLLGLLPGGQAFRQMRAAGTNPDPSEPTTAIVETGPFRYTRNPIYLAFTATYVGLLLLANTPWPLLSLPVVLTAISRGVIDREERYLERKFGADYLAYKTRVRRWL